MRPRILGQWVFQIVGVRDGALVHGWIYDWRRSPKSLFIDLTLPESPRSRVFLRFSDNIPIADYTPATVPESFLPPNRASLSPQSFQELIKVGARLVRQAPRRLVFQLAEVAVPREVFRQVLKRIGGSRRRDTLPLRAHDRLAGDGTRLNQSFATGAKDARPIG